MSFKYFLGFRPEDPVITSSTLTKIRKLRLKDMDLLDLLIRQSITIALDKDVIKSRNIILDATHTKSRYNHVSASEALAEQAKLLRKAVYSFDEGKRKDFPPKVEGSSVDRMLDYCRKLVGTIEKDKELSTLPAVAEKMSFLREMVDDNAEHLKLSVDEGAAVGHKTRESSFFGYKTHIAMTDERIITAATVTGGEKADGKYLEELAEKSIANGIEVDTIIGNSAYSGKENLQYTSCKGIQLVARLNPAVTYGFRKKEDEFEFNKDAGMYVCPSGHMAIRKARTGRKDIGKNQASAYYFDTENCRICPIRQGCYKDGAKSKTYGVKLKSPEHTSQLEFQSSEEFRQKAKLRYMIEAKNSELKRRHGLDVANSTGIHGMELQGATTIFYVNLKRILTILDLKETRAAEKKAGA